MSRSELVYSLINADNMDALLIGFENADLVLTCKNDIILDDVTFGVKMSESNIKEYKYSDIIDIINLDM